MALLENMTEENLRLLLSYLPKEEGMNLKEYIKGLVEKGQARAVLAIMAKSGFVDRVTTSVETISDNEINSLIAKAQEKERFAQCAPDIIKAMLDINLVVVDVESIAEIKDEALSFKENSAGVVNKLRQISNGNSSSYVVLITFNNKISDEMMRGLGLSNLILRLDRRARRDKDIVWTKIMKKYPANTAYYFEGEGLLENAELVVEALTQLLETGKIEQKIMARLRDVLDFGFGDIKDLRQRSDEDIRQERAAAIKT